jgi:nicotinamide-nucleotide amidase
MKLHLLFVGNKFIHNTILQEYIIRKVQQRCDYIASVTYFKENDNSLFLYLEQEFNSANKIVIVTTKSNFSTIGKLISTITSDNQILQENMLIPSNSTLYSDGTYLLEYKNSIVNVMMMDEMKMMPDILINNDENKAVINIFNEDINSAMALLNPLAQTHDVRFEIVLVVDEWLRVEIKSRRYGNISNFIESIKKLFDKKLILSSNVFHHIIEVLYKNQKKITFAESCTGGLLSYYFTKNNGASKILDGSLVTYSNELKENWLAVEHSTLEDFGAVSNEVVLQMSEGAINVSNADYSISISGIAGDTGGTETKPVGTVYIGVRTKTSHHETHFTLLGDRNYVQHQSVLEAVKMLLNIDKDIFF